MIFGDIANAGAAPALEATIRFAGQRQRLLAHNVANIDTPNFRPLEVSVVGFQSALAQAIRHRRDATGGEHGELDIPQTSEIKADADGMIHLTPRTAGPGVLYHDRNNRDVERLMQDVAENTMAFRTASDLYRRQNDLLRIAISQRV